MSVDLLEPRIRQILLSTPHADLGTITAKDVRALLLEEEPGVDEAWVKANKKQINQLIASVFEAVSAGVVPAHDAGTDAKEEDDSTGAYGGYSGGDDAYSLADDEDDGGPSMLPEKPKKSARTKRELTDEEYARQLSSELNARSRSSRSGKAPTARASKKGASRKPKNKKSAERVHDSDVSDGGSESDVKVKPKKKRAGGSGGGGAKGGFGKEYILSDPLSALLEVDRLSRPQVVKQLWIYIKANDLQNPSNKREILCDDRMKPVFNVDKIDMFKMNKVLGQHLHEDE
ncbi:hypothetical protein DFH11DRAFT_95718 [Phellopilus nigrolimitatus]|nr:hypothetical protein DFH11DRAFT_95718 [Phellopilus nigrolimitatus]